MKRAAQRVLGQLDSLVDITLDTAGGLFEVSLAHQPLDGGLATLDQGVVGLGRITAELLGGATQFVGAEPVANVIGIPGKPFLQLSQRGATVLDSVAGELSPLAQLEQDLVDGRQREVGGADRGQQRGLEIFDAVVSHGNFLS